MLKGITKPLLPLCCKFSLEVSHSGLHCTELFIITKSLLSLCLVSTYVFIIKTGDSNILKISPLSDKHSDIFHISAQNIDCGFLFELPHRGSSNEYPQSMFLSRHMKNNVYPCKPQFYFIKVGFKGFKIT